MEPRGKHGSADKPSKEAFSNAFSNAFDNVFDIAFSNAFNNAFSNAFSASAAEEEESSQEEDETDWKASQNKHPKKQKPSEPLIEVSESEEDEVVPGQKRKLQ